jgi:hypothetical protein
MCVSLSIYVYLRSLLRRGVLASDVVGQPPAKRRRVEEEWRRGWCQLDDGNVWKQFGDHWRKQNVDTLRDSASITFAYEERGEENRMYRLHWSLRPITRLLSATVIRLSTTTF